MPFQQLQQLNSDMKRSKNIFNSPIAPESLLEDEGNRQFNVGGISINSNWLTRIDPAEYKKYIVSALHLSELARQLSDLEQNHRENSHMKQSNLFKMGNIKKKIDNFTLIQVQQEKKPLGDDNLTKNQPPQTSDMKIQKIGGFFKGIIERKCKIQEKQLYIQSQKDEKAPWIRVGIDAYTLELQLKQHSITANKEEFKDFIWPQNETCRLILWGKELRTYCIYGKQEELKKFQRYFQVENIQLKQLGVFKKLETQFQQKVITLFGNKVRFYDHNLRLRRAQKQANYNSISKNRSPHQEETVKKDIHSKPIKQINSEVGQSSQVGQSSEMGQSGILDSGNQQNIGDKSRMNTSSEIILDGFKSFEKSKLMDQKQKKKGTSDVFKLKVKSSVVFYDELEDGFKFQQGDYSVADIKLNLKQEIGISDVEQQSLSVLSNKLGKGAKKVVHMSLKNALDQSQKFNINIHEASSFKQDDRSEKNYSEPSQVSMNRSITMMRQKHSLNISQINQPLTNKRIMRKSSEADSLLDQFQLENHRPDMDYNQQSLQSLKQEKENTKLNDNFLIKNFKKKKQGQIEIIEMPKKPETYFAIDEIEMLVPYHKDKLNFQILQIDPNLQMQRKIVVCSRAEACFEQRKDVAQRYTRYTTPGGFKFQVSKQSDEFMFVLIEQGKHHYLRFAVDPKPKYQRNCSQLLITQLDKEGFPFACNLVMFSSPTPIQLKPPLSTIEFMQKYLTEGENYDFKLDFIDDKRKRFLVKRQWNKHVMKNVVKNGDAEGFARSIFLGAPDSIISKLKKGLNYDPNKLFSFNENELRMMEENISSAGIMDLRAFMKPSNLIKHASQATYNKCLKQRLEQIYVYFLKRYGSIRNLALIFIKEVLAKVEPIIVLGRRQEQVYALLDLYFEVEYEIDELFLQVSKYFKK